MLRDRFDQLMLGALLLTLVGLGVLLAGAGAGSQASSAEPELKRRLDREIAYQARVAFIERHYQPVAELRDSGALQQALLKLEELGRTLPGDAHNALLSGDILLRMGQFDRALEKLADAVRRNGDYVDAASPLNRRDLVVSAVNEGLPLMRDRLRAHPDNRTLTAVVRDGYYLQSRLAGGCE